MIRTAPVAVVLLLLVCAGCGKKQPRQTDLLKDWQGSWEMLQFEDSRKPPTDKETLRKTTILVKDTHFITASGDVIVGESSIRIDPTKTPPEIDLTPLSGEHAGKVEMGIYKLEGKKLTLCIADEGQARPTEFAAKNDTTWTLIVLQRKD